MMIAKKSIKYLLGAAFMLTSTMTLAEVPHGEEHVKHDAQENAEEAHIEGHDTGNDEHAGHGEEHGVTIEGIVDTPDEIKAYIDHHLLDSYDFSIFTDHANNKHYGFPLPVIFFDEGMHMFMSSKFHHGESIAESNGKNYAIIHGKIHRVDEAGHSIKRIWWDFSLTKSVLGMLLIAVLLIFWFSRMAKRYKNNPLQSGLGRFLEPIIVYLRDEIARPNIGEAKYKKFMGYLLTVFFFILFLNLLGLTPFGFNITGNIAITFGLALFTFFVITFSGNKDYWGHIFWMPGVPVPMKIVLAPIEVLGMFTKPFALMIRLFANMSAGHVVVMSLIALVYTLKDSFGIVGSTSLSFILSIFIGFIEIFAAFLQAYVFTMLSALFIGMAVEEHH